MFSLKKWWKERKLKGKFYDFVDRMEWERAIQLADENEEILKDDDILFNYAWCCVEIGEFEKAEVILENLKDEFSYSPVYWILLAKVYLEREEEEKFFEAVESAKRIDPTHPVLRFLLGKYYARKGMLERAASEFEYFTSEYTGYKDALVLAYLERGIFLKDVDKLRSEAKDEKSG